LRSFLRFVKLTGFLLAMAVAGLVFIGLSFSLPAEPVTTCVTNSYGTFCTVHYLEGDRVISCGLPPSGVPVSCLRSLQWWINPIPFLYFERIEARMFGIVLLLGGIVGSAVLVLIPFDSRSGVRSQENVPAHDFSTPPGSNHFFRSLQLE
jgi:hypothetical protein